MRIDKRSDEFWKEVNPSENENAKIFLDVIFENQKEMSKTYSRAYYIVIVLAAIYWILTSGNVTEFSFLSIKINDIKVLSWIIPAIMGYAFYQGICAFIYELYLQKVTNAFFKQHLPGVFNRDLEPLAYSSSFFNFERFLANTTSRGKTVAVVFTVIVVLSIFFLPLFTVILCIYQNLRSLHGIQMQALLKVY